MSDIRSHLHSRKQRPQFEGHQEFKGSSGSICGGGGVEGQGGDMMLRFIQDDTDSVLMFLPSSHFQPR